MKRYLGIDPGTNELGYAIIEIKNKEIILQKIGTLHLKHLNHPHIKLRQIYETVEKLIRLNRPHELAIEAPFYSKNIQSMLKLGRAQGVAISAALNQGLEISEYSPKKIKQSVTGNGNASKEQVAGMLENLVNQPLDKYGPDATDALATAICHHIQASSALPSMKQKSGWSAFIKENPDRVHSPGSD